MSKVDSISNDNSKGISRRSFLRNTTMIAGGATAGMFIPGVIDKTNALDLMKHSNQPEVIITAKGRALIAKMQAEKKILLIDSMIFAYKANLGKAPTENEQLQPNDIVHNAKIQQQIRLSENAIALSTTLDSDVGPFKFNWSCLYCSEYDTIIAVTYPKLTTKTVDGPGVKGNTLIRSFILSYDDIAQITNSAVMAASPNFVAHQRLNNVENSALQAIIDQQGQDWFIKNGFMVLPFEGIYKVMAGVAYISGHRIELEHSRTIDVANKPFYIYVDAYKNNNDPDGLDTKFNIIASTKDLKNYVNTDGVHHYYCKLCQVMADGTVSDLRPQNTVVDKGWAEAQDHQAIESVSGLKIYPISRNLAVNDTIPEGYNGLRINDKIYRVICHGIVNEIDANATFVIVNKHKYFLQPCIEGQSFYSIDNLEHYEPLSDWGDKINYAAEICRKGGLILWIPNKTYQFNKTIELKDINVQWDGTLELCSNVIGVVFKYNVNLVGNPFIVRSRSLDHFDKAMVMLTSSKEKINGKWKTKGCVENKISQLNILNGWIDYQTLSNGKVLDSTKLTGRGLVLLAGSWTAGLTEQRAHEYVWRNFVSDVYVDGFEQPYVLEAVIDDITPNRWITWVNGNKLHNLCARRFRQGFTVISPLLRPNGKIGGEVAGNTCASLDFQWSRYSTESFLVCEGRNNKFELMGWDAPKTATNTIKFLRGNTFPPGYGEAAGNIVELYGATLRHLNGSDLSPLVYESNPGLNTFIAEGFQGRNLMPESSPPTVGSTLTNSYIPKLDNFLAFINDRPGCHVKLFKNGHIQTKVDLAPMFDFNPESAVRLAVKKGDEYKVVISLENAINHFNMTGSTLGYNNLTSGKIEIDLHDRHKQSVYSSKQTLKTANVTGFINATNIKTIVITYSGFDRDGKLNISSIYGQTYNRNAAQGVMTADGACWMQDDIKINKAGAGVVIRDEVNGQLYRIAIANGELKLAPVNK
ncbi:phage tail-collar fiber domain-containing protein [Photobacterium aquimaris]|uniref:Tail fiber protein n=1 Tax=Photobacterium aquimaris TaxID=512643 RepID=A0A1Y6KWQ4_9GAMM|nr:phage tail protein [Photobacterium aquimaris]SMY16484.1 Tail fiber protein [Photobacterium aquimaris]